MEEIITKAVSFIDSLHSTNVEIFGRNISLLSILLAVSVASVAATLWQSNSVTESKKKKALNPDEWQSFKLKEVFQISHDVIKLRFALQSDEHILGLPIGQHISLKFIDEDGKDVIRSYTPTSSDNDVGHVDFVVKVYKANVHPKFPLGGKMSQHLASLKVGDSMLMKGPKGHLEYLGRGKFTITKRSEVTEYRKKRIGMVAGGTGITPMLQIIAAIMRDPSDRTELWLIFANQREEDILLRKELEALQSDRFHLFYTLDNPPEGWTYGKGFINKEMCAQNLPAPSPDTMLYVCGPPPMIQYACEPAFKEIGFTPDQWFAF